jgi:methylated-DNA-[protein]-cysteine S-methyltransferase
MNTQAPHHILQTRLATPLGPMTAARSARGLSGLWFDDQKHHPGQLDLPDASDDALFQKVAAALDAYFQGQVLPQDLALDPQGTPFQQAVWHALLGIPAGASRSYGELARALGRPQAVRALGAAVGRNPVSILIPCHRVLGGQGQLTGYAGGLARKSALLRLEGAVFQRALDEQTPSLGLP